MDKAKLETILETTREEADERNDDVRTLRDLELLLVGGGGDDSANW